MSCVEIHVGDIGTALRCTILDEDSVAVNLSSASSITIKLLKPDSTIVTFTGALYTDGTDGIVQYVTATANDLDQSGIWKIQAIVTFGVSDSHYSNLRTFRVHPNI